MRGRGIPGRSQIVGWPITRLESADGYWSATAQRWEEQFTTLHTATLSPGGMVWEGTAADAAQDRAWADVVKVRGLADCLYNAATAARIGADDIARAKRRALDAITEAEKAGFSVGEDLSVADRSITPLLRGWGAGQSQVKEFGADIHAQVQSLASVDKAVAGRITTALAPLDAVRFAESPKDGTVQAVDFKEAPPPSLPCPINDVIAEATDLDGNHVVMRRDYYDAVTNQGFGWDKAYWRHGVINPNVFKDLISHSQPIRNDGGTLVDDVPINRARCTSGLFGLNRATTLEKPSPSTRNSSEVYKLMDASPRWSWPGPSGCPLPASDDG